MSDSKGMDRPEKLEKITRERDRLKEIVREKLDIIRIKEKN